MKRNEPIAGFGTNKAIDCSQPNYTDWTNNIFQYRLSPHYTICLIPSAFTPESIRDKIYKILAYYINHIGITLEYSEGKHPRADLPLLYLIFI